MADEEENEHEKEYPGGRVGINARIIKDKENEVVIIEEINHGYLNDGYDKFLYEDEGTNPVGDYQYLILMANQILQVCQRPNKRSPTRWLAVLWTAYGTSSSASAGKGYPILELKTGSKDLSSNQLIKNALIPSAS